MKLYRVLVTLEVEAKDEESACRQAEAECTSSSFVCVESVREVIDNPEE